jgi:hypothetical protein
MPRSLAKSDGVLNSSVGGTFREHHEDPKVGGWSSLPEDSDRHFGVRRFIAAFVSSPSEKQG